MEHVYTRSTLESKAAIVREEEQDACCVIVHAICCIMRHKLYVEFLLLAFLLKCSTRTPLKNEVVVEFYQFEWLTCSMKKFDRVSC